MQYSLKSVVKGASIYTVGQLITKATAFFLIPLYTHYLTPSEYGIVGYLDVFFQILASFLTLGLYGAQTRYLYEANASREKLGEYLFSTNFFLFCLLIGACGSLTFYGNTLHGWLGTKDIPFNPYFLYIIWTPFFFVMNQMVITFFLAEKRYFECATRQILQFGFLTLMTILFVVILKQGALGQVKGLFWGQVVFFLLFYPQYFRKFNFVFRADYIKYGLHLGIPIELHAMAGVVLNTVNRVILESYVTKDQLGLYTLGYQIGMAVSVISRSINNAWQPNFYELMNGPIARVENESRRFFALWTLLLGNVCMAGVTFCKEILMLFVSPQYQDAFIITRIILISFFVQAFYFIEVTPIFYNKKVAVLPWLTGGAAALNIWLNFSLIPRYGINGAALAQGLSFLVLAGLVHLVGRRYFDPDYEYGRALVLLLMMFPAFLIEKSGGFIWSLLLGKFVYFVLFAAVSLVLFKKHLPDLRKMAFRK
jgi:O-antigen/teichoic acid export membrane protein